ncbi:MAG TPA: hypothetical protein VGG03_13730 [Thermoanaerobaculia bacterium]|jgi:hypothetical protein
MQASSLSRQRDRGWGFEGQTSPSGSGTDVKTLRGIVDEILQRIERFGTQFAG